MLHPIPPARVLHEWGAISADLKRAMERDPGRNWLDILGQAISGELSFWCVGGPTAGYLTAQIVREPRTLRRTFWVVYGGGDAGSLEDKRQTMKMIEDVARAKKCTEVRFEGRPGWRKAFPDYVARQSEDGRWHYRKTLQ